jgi:hypothetical protein
LVSQVVASDHFPLFADRMTFTGSAAQRGAAIPQRIRERSQRMMFSKISPENGVRVGRKIMTERIAGN